MIDFTSIIIKEIFFRSYWITTRPVDGTFVLMAMMMMMKDSLNREKRRERERGRGDFGTSSVTSVHIAEDGAYWDGYSYQMNQTYIIPFRQESSKIVLHTSIQHHDWRSSTRVAQDYFNPFLLSLSLSSPSSSHIYYTIHHSIHPSKNYNFILTIVDYLFLLWLFIISDCQSTQSDYYVVVCCVVVAMTLSRRVVVTRVL